MSEAIRTSSRNKRTSIRDVAQEAGVSASTVSLILNGKMSGAQETRNRVLEAAQRLGYEPDALFRKAVSERARANSGEPAQKPATKILAFVLPQWMQDEANSQDGYYSRVIGGVVSAAATAGYHILLCPQESEPKGIPSVIQDDKVDGILVEGSFPLDWLSLLANHLPCVYMDRYYPGLNAIFVTANWPGAGRAQVDYAWNNGHRNFAFFEQDPRDVHFLNTYRSFHAALEQLGGSLIHPRLSRLRDTGTAAGVDAFVEEWLALKERPTVILTTDNAGSRLAEALMARGIKVPEEVSIIGRTGHISGLLSQPPLTTYAYPLEDIAETATRLLLECIQSGTLRPAHMMLDGRFIIRSSVRSLF